jgi:hypothetical protein
LQPDKETYVARDQLSENINAAMELRNAGKTVCAAAEHAAAAKNTGPNFNGDMGGFVKEPVEAGQSEDETVDKG